MGSQWLSGRVLDSRPRGRRFEPHGHHCVVSLSKNINPRLVLVQPRKTCLFINERLLLGRKESNQTKTRDKKMNEIILTLQTKKNYCYIGFQNTNCCPVAPQNKS